jgi:hypothetical protein
MECTRLVALAVMVVAALGAALAVPGSRLGASVAPATGTAPGPHTVVLASGSSVRPVRATNRAW